MKNRQKKLTQNQYQQMVKRCQRYVDRSYFYRMASLNGGPDRYGFLGPSRPSQEGATIDLAQRGAQHWEIMVIVYCEDTRGDQYREAVTHRTEQRIKAWRPREDEHGEFVRDDDGQIDYEDQLLPIIKACKEAAEASVNHRHIKDIAVIMRPWSKAWPSMAPVLKRLQKELSLQDWEIHAFTEEDQ